MTLYNDLKSIKIQLDRIEQLLLEQKILSKEILDVKEAAKFCGLKQSYIYKLCSQRDIPHYKNSGRMLRFQRTELEGWLLRNRVQGNQNICEKANSYIIKSKL